MNHQRQKIIFSLVISYLAIMVMVNAVFLANTPRINPLFIAKLKNIPSSLVTLPSRILAALSSPQRPSNSNTNINPAGIAQNQPNGLTFTNVNPPPSTAFRPMAAGVFAGENTATKTKYVTIKKGTQFEVRNYTLTLSDGSQKQIKLLVPIGQ